MPSGGRHHGRRQSKGRSKTSIFPISRSGAPRPIIAKEAGLEPLASLLFTQPGEKSANRRAAFVNAEKQVPDVAAALDGARAILVERFAEDADLIGSLRELMLVERPASSKVRDGQNEAGASSATFRFGEALAQTAVAPHFGIVPRRKEEILDLTIDPEGRQGPDTCGRSSSVRIAHMHRFGISDRGRLATNGSSRRRAGRGAPRSWVHLPSSALRLWNAANRKPCGCSPQLRDLLLAAPAGAAPRWA